jgi:hypothetical protein
VTSLFEVIALLFGSEFELFEQVEQFEVPEFVKLRFLGKGMAELFEEVVEMRDLQFDGTLRVDGLQNGKALVEAFQLRFVGTHYLKCEN